jgi:hypothetical protein
MGYRFPSIHHHSSSITFHAHLAKHAQIYLGVPSLDTAGLIGHPLRYEEVILFTSAQLLAVALLLTV